MIVLKKPIEDPDEAEKARREDCTNYSRCLDIAAHNRYKGFSCVDCREYEPDPEYLGPRKTCIAPVGYTYPPPCGYGEGISNRLMKQTTQAMIRIIEESRGRYEKERHEQRKETNV